MADSQERLVAAVAQLTVQMTTLGKSIDEHKAVTVHCQDNCVRYREAIYTRINQVKDATDAKISTLVTSVGRLCGAKSAKESWQKLVPHWFHVLVLILGMAAAYWAGFEKGLH